MNRPSPAATAAAPALPWRAYLALASGMAIVGAYVGASKLLVATFPVFLLAWLRFGIGAVAMAGWLKRGAGEAPLDRRDRRLLFLGSLVGNFLFSICMLYGVALTSAVAAGVVMAALPAVVGALSWLVLRERIGGRLAAAIACAVAGVALTWVARADGGAAARGGLGTLLLVGAVSCEAGYVVIGKRLTGRIGAKRISAFMNLWGLALTTPFGLRQAAGFDFAGVGPGAWALLAGYSIAAGMLTVWLWMTGLKTVPAARAGVFTVLLPTGSAAVGVVFLGERFDAAQGAAFALALAGVLLATWPTRSASPR